MELLKFVSLLLLVLSTVESQRPSSTTSEKPVKTGKISSIVLKESVSYIDKEMFDNRLYFLYNIKKLTPKGQYFNQTEADFVNLRPGCPCVNKPSDCDSDCCYCKLKCPVPKHPFTGELMFPHATNCSKDSMKEMTSSQGKKEMRPLFPWLCERIGDSHDDISRFATLMCIHDVNLHSVNIFYYLNSARTDGEEVGNFLVPLYNWRHISVTRIMSQNAGPREIKSKELMTVAAEEDLRLEFMSANATGIDNETESSVIQAVNGINFTLDNISNGLVNIRILQDPQFSFKAAQPRCSQFSRGRSLKDCVYFINAISLTTCDQIRTAINITTQVVAYILSSRMNVSFMRTHETFSDGGKAVVNESYSLECSEIPGHGMITEVLHRQTSIGVYVNSFTNRHLLQEEFDIPLTLSYEMTYISDRELMNLPGFWDNFVYGECSESYCWRDLGNIGPPEAWTPIGLDDALLRNLVYLILPFLPIVLFCCLNTLF